MSCDHSTIDSLTITGKCRREAAKLYGLVLDHIGILNNMGDEPCRVRVQLAKNLDERGQYFKLWRVTDKIYAETFISPQIVSKEAQNYEQIFLYCFCR